MTGAGELDPKQSRKEFPTGWMYLTRYETKRYIIDALLESPPSDRFNKSELARRTGMSRDSIREHIQDFVNLGVIDEVEEGGWPEYELNENGRVTQALFNLNNAVNAVKSGRNKEIPERPPIRLNHIDRSDWKSAQQFQKEIKLTETG